MSNYSLMSKLNISLAKFIVSKPYDVIIRNWHIFPYELDLIRIIPSGSFYEYEIKISRSDFLVDFRKGFKKRNKHNDLINGLLTPNYFTFVLKKGIYNLDEIPEKFGIIEFEEQESGRLSIITIRNAKKLHKRKFDNWKLVANKLANRDNNQRNQSYFKYINYKKL